MRCKHAKERRKGAINAERGVQAKEERERERGRVVTEEEDDAGRRKQKGDAEKRRQTEKASDRVLQGATEKEGLSLQSVEEI
jgi:hypothetical protein